MTMQIADARKKAGKHLADHLLHSNAKRPPQGARVMTRWPTRGGVLITADSEEELAERLAKKMQAAARRAN